MSTIDEKELSEKTAAELDGAPFPGGRIPEPDGGLGDADGLANAFGDNKSAAPLDVEDSVIEEPAGDDKIPNNFVEQAASFGGADGENEFGNTAVSEFHEANGTSAEELTIAPKEDKKPEPKAEAEAKADDSEEAKSDDAPRRGRPRASK